MRPFDRQALVVVLASLVAGHASALAAPPKELKADVEARRLLEEMVTAYKGLESYSDQGELTLSATAGGKEHREALALRLSFARPNRLDLTAGPVRLVSDGKTLTTVIGPVREYLQEGAPKQVGLETLRRGPAGSIVFGGPGGQAVEILWSLLTEPEPVRTFADLGGAVKLDPDQRLDGLSCRVLRIEPDSGPALRLLVDPETKLVKQIDWLVDPDKTSAGFPEGRKVSVTNLVWASGKISTKAFEKDAFAFERPEGFRKIEPTIAAEEDQEASKFPVKELVGKPAPDFTLTLLDGPGKTRTVAKPDLAGKVVVIDFWATWCAPCIAELPDLRKLIERYEKDKKEVVVIALSQDQRPSELAEVRKVVESKLHDEKIDLLTGSVGRIGLDPSGTVGEAFQVTALPTVVILDGQGTVQAAHVGVNPLEILSKDVDALLEGKSLVKPARAGGAEGK